MRHRITGRVIRLALCLAFLASVASATPIRDVVHQPSLNAGWTVAGDTQFAQTFLIGMSGLLTGIDLSIGRESNPLASGDVIVSILPTEEHGVPARDLGRALASRTLPAAHWITRDTVTDPFSYRHVEFLVPFSVTVGETLAIYVAHGAGVEGDTLYWYGSGNLYPNGGAYSRVGSGSAWAPIADADFAFVTYVDTPQSVPDPGSTLLLLGIGLAGLVGAARRRK